MVSRLDILRALSDELTNPYARGPLSRLPAPIRTAMALNPLAAPFVGPGAHLGDAIASKVTDNPVGKAATGVLLATLGARNEIDPVARLASDHGLLPGVFANPAKQAMESYAASTDQNPFTRARAANEAGAKGNEFLVGAADALADPVNLLGPAGKGLQATKLARLGQVLQLADEMQAMPLELLGTAAKRGGAAAKSALLRRVLTEAIPTTGKAGSIPEHLMPLVDGARQLGPQGPARPLDLPGLAPSQGEYNLAARGAGLPGLPKTPPYMPDRLAPDAPSLTALASRGAPEASPLDLTGEVSRLSDYNKAARQVGLPEVQALPKQSSPLAPENFSLFRAAKERAKETRGAGQLALREAQQATPPALTAPLELPRAKAAPAPLAPLLDQTDELADRTYRAQGDLQGAVAAAYGDRAQFALPALLKKLGATVDRFGRVVREGRDITENVLMYLDDHAKLGGKRKAVDARYGQLLGDLTPPDATPGQLDQLIAETTPNVDIPQERDWDAYAAEISKLSRKEADEAGIQAAKNTYPRAAVDEVAQAVPDVADETGTEALRAEFRQGLASAIEQGKDDEAFAILDMAGDYGYPRGEASALYDELKGSGSLLDQQKELIETGPYFSVFKHFNPNGELKKRNPITGKPLRAAGGKFGSGREEVWNIPESGYDDVAAEAMAQVGGYSAANATDADVFWPRAQQAFKQYQLIKQGKDIAPQSFAGDIAAGGGGGGGGGLGLLGYPGGINGPVGRAIIPASASGIAGAAVGAGVGAMADDEDRLGGALKGAGIGAGVGFAAGGAGSMADLKVPQYLKPVLQHSASEFRRGMVEATEKSTGSVISAIKNLPATWRISVTQHPRNILGDEVWGRTVLGGGQGRESQALLANLRNDMAGRMGAANPWDREATQVRDLQRVLGRDGQLPNLGDSMAQAEKKLLTTTDTMIGGTLLSLLNPAGIATNVLGLGAAAGIGAARPGIRAFFEAFNGFQQATFRRAAYLDEAGQGLRIAAQRLLPDLRAAGVDVSRLAPDGMFSASDVRALAGQQAADRWGALTDTVREQAENRVKFLFGDYSKRNLPEKLAGGAVPFTSWLIRAYPVGVAMLAQHPAVALGLYHYLNATRPDTESGQPAYSAGMIPISTDTLIIGAILEAYMGGAEGAGYVDPIGAISPFGGELVQPAQSDEGKNWYQQATGWLERAGLPGVNPAIQIAANATGLDYKQANSTSRTKGLEEGLALIPGNPQLPNVMPNLLAATRSGLSPALEGVVPGVEADKHAAPYDPITRRYSELVMAETHKPLNDPSNAAYLAGMADPSNPLLQQARREVLLGGAAKNAASLSSPIGVIGQTAENKEYRAAAQGLPFTFDRIEGTKTSSPLLADLMTGSNEQYRKANPAADMYKVGNPTDARYEQLRAWEKQNADFKFVVGETIYNREKRKKMEELGLVEPAGVK